MKKLLFPFPLERDSIQNLRAQILTKLLAADEGFSQIPVKSISADTLDLMLRLYDSLFLGGTLLRLNIRVTISSRLTSAAGKFIYVKGLFGRITQPEIRMSSDFLFRLNQGPFELNGLSVSTPQEAFLLVFEHELCHALEACLYGKTAHSDRFMSLAHGLFGHQTTRHKLPTRRQEAADQGLLIGSHVAFIYAGTEKTGIITYIGKTATVMVPSSSGLYRDQRGRRYEKYRVQLKNLMKAENSTFS